MELRGAPETEGKVVASIHLPLVLGVSTVRDLRRTLESAMSDAGCRVLVLSSMDQAFCHGLDADELGRIDDPLACQGAIDDFVACLRAIRLGPKPCVALVDGAVLGGGMGLAAACDVVVATERASFAFPETLFGMIPAMVLPLVLERMLPQKVRLWALTGTRHSVEQACAAGFVDEQVPSERLAKAGQRWARRLGRAKPRAVRALVDFSARAAHLNVEDALIRGGGLTLEAIMDPEVRNTLRIFREQGVLDSEGS